jgi:putative salt-induced outer membrane protein YdiY/sRNA-binding regulator protein Hfq
MTVRWWVGVLFLLLSTGEAFADKILMKNGDRLQGTLEQVDGNVLIFSTDYSETLKLQTSQIKRIFTKTPVKIHLNNGNIVTGRIQPSKPGQIKVTAPSGGGYALIGWEQIQSINPPPEKWEGTVLFGGSKNSGNTDRFSASLGGELKRKFKDDIVEFKFLSNYSEENKKVTARNTYGTSKFSHFFNSKWFSYLALGFLTDTFRDLTLRTTIGPGLGYQVWDDARKSLNLEVGYSYIIENRREGPDEKNSNARLASEFSYKLIEQLTFANQVAIFPDLENTGEYTLRNQASLKTNLGNGWELKMTNVLARDSSPGINVKKNDVYWIFALGYAF